MGSEFDDAGGPIATRAAQPLDFSAQVEAARQRHAAARAALQQRARQGYPAEGAPEALPANTWAYRAGRRMLSGAPATGYAGRSS